MLQLGNLTSNHVRYFLAKMPLWHVSYCPETDIIAILEVLIKIEYYLTILSKIK